MVLLVHCERQGCGRKITPSERITAINNQAWCERCAEQGTQFVTFATKTTASKSQEPLLMDWLKRGGKLDYQVVITNIAGGLHTLSKRYLANDWTDLLSKFNLAPTISGHLYVPHLTNDILAIQGGCLYIAKKHVSYENKKTVVIFKLNPYRAKLWEAPCTASIATGQYTASVNEYAAQYDSF